MIETLKGMQETVNFREHGGLLLYDNTECENYPSHWHAPLEIIMSLENEYSAICNNNLYHLKEGDVLIINSGVIHSLYSPPKGRRIIFQPNFSLLHNVKDLESTLTIISPVALITAENSPAIHDKIHHLMLEILDEYNADAPLSEASIYAKLIALFVLIGRNITSTSEISTLNNSKQKIYAEKFLFVCDYINEHCTEDLSLDLVADLTGFSKYHFTRLFKQFTNISFYKYLNQKRIANAENLLINPDISITEVALHSGFTSLSSFIRMFKLIKNCTPTEFRHMYST